MSEVAALLAAFHGATGRQVALWERRDGDLAPRLLGSSSAIFADRTSSGPVAWDVTAWSRTCGLVAHLADTGESIGWLIVEPGLAAETDRLLSRLIPFVRRLERERDGAAHELAGRYEEINLLYAISELLGGTVSVERVASTLLHELAETVGATQAVFLRTERGQSVLTAIAALGVAQDSYADVAIDSPTHIAARAFRSAGTCTEDGAAACIADPILGVNNQPLLAVAMTRPSSGVGVTGAFPIVSARRLTSASVEMTGTVPVGVLVLSRQPGRAPFSAGDRKLASAVATQIGSAMHNAALVRAAVERQQLEREMRLAHDLQLKLLPHPRVVGPEARAAARVVAAESVGGDFYLLARLDRDRTGVLIGDVSGHGYQSALVMALALSAAAIHVQAAFDPSIALEAVQRSLADELDSTEMSITLCYAVIDSRAGELRFANAGHPHAFRVSRGGDCTRLHAVAPPIGFSSASIDECVMTWRPGDRLVLFTDGLTDARNSADVRLGEGALVEQLRTMSHGETPEEMLHVLLATVDAHVGGTTLRDDLAAVIVDRQP